VEEGGGGGGGAGFDEVTGDANVVGRSGPCQVDLRTRHYHQQRHARRRGWLRVGRGLRRCGRGAGVRPEVVGRIGSAHAVGVAGRGGQSRVGEGGRRGRRDLREGGAADAGAAFDEISRHANVVRRGGPGQIDLRA